MSSKGAPRHMPPPRPALVLVCCPPVEMRHILEVGEMEFLVIVKDREGAIGMFEDLDLCLGIRGTVF